jgi:hypothetical protein
MSKLSDLPQDFLREGHCIQKSASGTSMLPSITDGTVLQIEPLEQDRVRLGDVVYFLDNNGNTKIHRVSCMIKKGNNTLIQTWGDNCENPDTVIKRSQILGRVIAYRGENEWHQMDARAVVYAKYFLKRYGWYYIKKIPGRLSSFLNHHA